MGFKVIILALLLVFLNSSLLPAGELTGEEILDKLNNNINITASGQATIKLVTENSKGQQREYKLKIYRQEEAGQEKQLLEYLEPADVEGTKFLSVHTPEQGEEQMWLFLPALGRERRIAGHMTRDNFMGTDFTFEEIGGGKDYNDDYRAKRLVDQELAGYLTYQLQLIPVDQDLDYGELRMWVWQQEMQPLAIDFYNRAGELWKQLIFSDFEQGDDGELFPQTIIMSNQEEGSRTIIEIIENSSEVVDQLYFSLQYLRR